MGPAGLDALLHRLDEVVVCCRTDGVITYVSPGIQILAGYSASDLVGHNLLDFVHPDEHAEIIEGLVRWSERTGAPQGQEHRIRAADGSWLPVQYDATLDPALEPFGGMALTLRAASSVDDARRALVTRLLNEDRLVRLASTFLARGVDDFDAGVRAALAELSGLEWVTRLSVWLARGDDVEVVAQWEAQHDAPRIPLPASVGSVAPHLVARLRAGEEMHVRSVAHLPEEDWAEEREWFDAAGVASFLAVPMRDEDRFVGFVLAEVTLVPIAFDVTHLSTLRSAAAILAGAHARSEVERELTYRARNDALTDLPNRWSFEERLARCLRAAGSDGLGVAVAVVNIDRFARVNEALGHEAGDQVLALAALRLRNALSGGAWLARGHGDEFLVLHDRVASASVALERTEPIVAALRSPFDLHGRPVALTASVGIAHTSPPATLPASELLRHADAACRRAHELGGNRAEVDDGGGAARTLARIEFEGALRRAVGDGGIDVYYQPELDIRSGDVVGAEALARWVHPSQGLLPAKAFIDVAEECGVIDDLGAQVLRSACRTAAGWPTGRDGGVAVRVNVSAHQLFRQDLVGFVGRCLDDSGLAPHRLVLELTESALLVDPDRAVDVLWALRGLGVGLAVDDFGTGYSSLLYLKRLPVSSVKVDKVFVDGLPDDGEDRAIVSAIVQLADTLGLGVTAEGVERDEQRDALVRLGCGFAQGFLLGRPEPAEVFAARLVGRS